MTGSKTGAMVAPLSGLAQVVAGEPQLRGVVKHLGEPELHMTGCGRISSRRWPPRPPCWR